MGANKKSVVKKLKHTSRVLDKISHLPNLEISPEQEQKISDIKNSVDSLIIEIGE